MAQKNGKDLKTPVRNIFLTGFMCSGKSGAGRILARRLGLAFADSDALAERRGGRTVREIAESAGMAAFRRLESACVRDLAAGSGRVAALGGGIYPVRRWRGALGAGGVTVFLYCPWPELEKRLKKARGPRPLLSGPWEKAGPRAKKLYARRLPYYRRADITVNTAGLTPAGTAAAIIEELKNENFQL